LQDKPVITVLTYLTSPYQVELFNAIHSEALCDLRVIYLYSRDPIRSWEPRPLTHTHVVVEDKPSKFRAAAEAMEQADLAVFNFYDHPLASKLMRQRARSDRAWCFWGERPGFSSSEWVGRLFRRWGLAPLHRTRVPIWGIGQFAIEQYKREFGSSRKFFNLPYYSDLSRFACQRRNGRVLPGTTTFLFSGSLIFRKGVDLLARAFARLAAELPGVRLRLLGEGRLRPELERGLQPFAERVEFVGFRDWDDLPAEYGQADVLCVPSRYDGWGMVVPEGLAAGLPVIATEQTGATLDLVEPGRNGWLIPAGDEKALYQAMKKAVLLSPAQFSERSRAARQTISQHSLSKGVERFWCAAQGTMAEFDDRTATADSY
jgi:glycosyltransferase involved in cell wall biosynthesis